MSNEHSQESPAPEDDLANLSYSQARFELEEIVEKLDDADLDVDVVVDLVKRATKLHKLCDSKLRRAIDELDEVVKDQDG